MNGFRYLYLPLFILLTTPVAGQSVENDVSTWSWIKNKASEMTATTAEKSETVIRKTKKGSLTALAYLNKNYGIAKDGTVVWTKETYNQFNSDHPEVAANIQSFAAYTSETGQFAYEKTKDGALVAYEVSSDGVKTAVSWTDEKIEKLPEVTACGIAEYDVLGGIAIGTLGTALAAGTTTATTTSAVVFVAPTMFGWMTVGTAATTTIVSTPVIAIGVTAAAVAGATLYATAKGLCYAQNKETD